MGIHHLATFRRCDQEEKSQCKLAASYLTIYLGLLTAFAVPLHLRPPFTAGAPADRALDWVARS